MFQRVRVPELESDRLLLRGWNKRDAADLYEYASDPLVGPAAGWAPHRNQSESRMIIDQIYTTKLDWAIVDKSSNKPIGNIGLDDDGKDKITLFVETELQDKARYNLEIELHNRIKSVINVGMIVKAEDIGDLPRSEKKTTRVFDYRY